MKHSRREFLSLLPGGFALATTTRARGPEGSPEARAAHTHPRIALAPRSPLPWYDPWVEVDPAALRANVRTVSRLTSGRPILAVVKNNAYGLGLELVADVLEPLGEIHGFAVVKAEAALRLRRHGIQKPVLLMGLTPPDLGPELMAQEVVLSMFDPGDAERAAVLARNAGAPIPVHQYVDTGMNRMGIGYRDALSWMATLQDTGAVDIRGTYMAFTEETEFDHEQLRRFRSLTASALDRGRSLGALHAASSNGVYHLPDAHLDMVRPGIALFGAYPSRPDEERAKAPLTPAVRLKARVVRVARLRAGDSVSYGRSYVAEGPTWIATLPVGHTDGVTRRAVDGARVLIGGRTFPVIGAVSASHTIVEIGPEPVVRVGDVATLVGPDHPDIHPNELARVTGVSVYDVLMHLSPSLPRHTV